MWLGLSSAAVSLGVAHLVAGLVGDESSPVVAVGSATIDLAPRWLKDVAIDVFGTADKAALLVGIGVVVAAIAVVLGFASVRRPQVGLASLGVFGALLGA